MLKYAFLAAALVLGLSAPAYAGSCPKLSKEITAALEKSDLPDAKKAEIMELQKQGDAQHSGGEHGKSVETLKAALKMLGM